MVRRAATGRSVFTADDQHTHHRLLRAGFSQPQVALILYGVATAFTGAAVTIHIYHADSVIGMVTLVLALSGGTYVFSLAGYGKGIQETFSLFGRARKLAGSVLHLLGSLIR